MAVQAETRPTGRAQDDGLEGWLRLAEAARLAGVSRMTIHRAASRGELVYVVVPGPTRLFRQQDVERWATRRGT
ncbi:MAG: helix-turn-helix domain-containing protein [Gaiellaceae bacterium]